MWFFSVSSYTVFHNSADDQRLFRFCWHRGPRFHLWALCANQRTSCEDDSGPVREAFRWLWSQNIQFKSNHVSRLRLELLLSAWLESPDEMKWEIDVLGWSEAHVLSAVHICEVSVAEWHKPLQWLMELSSVVTPAAAPQNEEESQPSDPVGPSSWSDAVETQQKTSRGGEEKRHHESFTSLDDARFPSYSNSIERLHRYPLTPDPWP